MEYIVVNTIDDKEIIFSSKLLEYKLLWKGHKLSIVNEKNIFYSLLKIVETKNPKKEFSLDYKVWFKKSYLEDFSFRHDVWNDISVYSIEKTYNDILKIMDSKFGYFNKLFIYEKNK